MHWWNPRSPSSSPSSPKSAIDSPSSPSKQRRPISFFKNRHGNSAINSTTRQRRLTRQRKLRHVSDLEICLVAGNFTSYSTSVSRSSSNLDRNSSQSPLPLPELSTLLQRDPGAFSPFSGSSSGCCPLPSPSEVFCRGEGDEVDAVCGYVTDSLNGDGGFVQEGFENGRAVADFRQQNQNGGRNLPGFDTGRLPGQIVRRTTQHIEAPPTGSPLEPGRKSLQVTNFAQNIQNGFQKSIAAKSAPTSCFSSPMHSPRRSSNRDVFASYTPSQGLEVLSALDIPFSGPEMITGTSTYASQEKVIASSDRSGLHSTSVRSSGLKSDVPTATASPLHPKVSSESFGTWHESGGNVTVHALNVTVHPLPLPPGATVSLLSPLVHQASAKPEPSSMTDQWQKGKLIGSGTYGHVFVATNKKTGALCAMKEVSLIPNDPKSAECMKQLEQEIKVLGQLKHPNIVQYYGSEIIEDRFYIYLEYVYPGSINKYIHEHVGAVTESVVRNFTRHILLGLAYLHSTKTVHRDIKGANLLVDSSGVVKLADFGMAKHLNGPASVLSLKGTPHWMAPEVIVHQESGYDLAVDIWSLGCTIIEMYTGKPPWSEFEGAAAMFKVCKNESPPIPDNLSADGKDFLQCCFRRNPADRPTAIMLLKHPFIEETPSCIQSFSGMKLQDIGQSPTDRTNHTTDLMYASQPQGMQATKAKQVLSSDDGQSHLGTSKSAAKTHHSPCSTLEVLPSLSPPRSNNGTSKFGPSSNLQHGIRLGSGHDHLYALPKYHRKELSHIS